MKDAAKQLTFDCGNAQVLSIIVAMLIGTRIATIEDAITWYILPNKWAVRDGQYRINIYDENGDFFKHVYSREEVKEVVLAEYYDRMLDSYFHGDK